MDESKQTIVYYKIAVMGTKGVGKTSIIDSYTKGKRSYSFRCERTSSVVTGLNMALDDKDNYISFRFHDLPSSLDTETESETLKEMSAFILVVDGTSYDQHNQATTMINKLQNFVANRPVLVLFNKQDAQHFAVKVNNSAFYLGKKYITDENIRTVSARNNVGIDEAMTRLVYLLQNTGAIGSPSLSQPIVPPVESENHRVCVLGDAYVGKTSIIRRYVNGDFASKYIPTRAINGSGNFSRDTILFMDIPAHTSPEEMKVYLKDATGLIYVVDCTQKHSMIDADSTLSRLLKLCPPKTPYRIFLNKSDIPGTYSKDMSDLLKIKSHKKWIEWTSASNDDAMLVNTIDKLLNERTQVNQNSKLETGVARFRDVLKNHREIVLVHDKERYFAKDVTELLYSDTVKTTFTNTNRYVVKCGTEKGADTVYFLIEHVTSLTADPLVHTTSFDSIGELRRYTTLYPRLDKIRLALCPGSRVSSEEY